MEQWKPLKYGLVTYLDYEVSNLGRIKSIPRVRYSNSRGTYTVNGTLMAQRHTKKSPHLFVDIFFLDENNERQRKTIYIHKAVYNTFVGQETDYVTHDDRDVTHNYPHNLKSISHSELQIRNMQEHPEARQRLAKRNKKVGHYKKMADMLSHSDETIALIKKLSSEGKTIHEIAVEANVSYSSVSKYK